MTETPVKKFALIDISAMDAGALSWDKTVVALNIADFLNEHPECLVQIDGKPLQLTQTQADEKIDNKKPYCYLISYTYSIGSTRSPISKRLGNARDFVFLDNLIKSPDDIITTEQGPLLDFIKKKYTDEAIVGEVEIHSFHLFEVGE